MVERKIPNPRSRLQENKGKEGNQVRKKEEPQTHDCNTKKVKKGKASKEKGRTPNSRSHRESKKGKASKGKASEEKGDDDSTNSKEESQTFDHDSKKVKEGKQIKKSKNSQKPQSRLQENRKEKASEEKCDNNSTDSKSHDLDSKEIEKKRQVRKRPRSRLQGNRKKKTSEKKEIIQNLKDYIITTRKKSGSSNKLCYCKACYNKYGENNPELKAIVDKTDCILSHFQNCSNFDEAYNQEEKKIIFSLASKKKINLDKRSAYNAARLRLRNQHRELVFLPCYAHQVNLCVGGIFKVSSEFKITSSYALKIAAYFKNANNKYFIGQLRTIQKEIYGKYIQPMIPACYNKYGENNPELKAIVDKTDCILSHFQNCSNFDEAYNQEEKKIIFSLASKKKINLDKRSASSSSAQVSLFSAQASSSSTQALSLLNYGPLDNFITRPLSSIDRKKFNLLILRVTISCGFALSWVNNPEVIELFKFLNPLIKLSDRKTLSDKILHEAFKITSSYALKIAAYFKNANNKYFIGQLRTIQKEIYGKYIQPMIPGDTRWNSYLICCSSIRATKNALRSLATKFEPSQSNTCRQPNDPLTISQDIYSIIMNENFWENLIKLEQLLIPYCQILNILQTDKARLYEVLYGFAYLTQF
ncbi:hypothetical protein Glove_46g111 [Diversispora epigaea]|uniref:DUF659 domain-containing protein n=1 Tax=Diversispora epigaea TaxID=1348612 RepID=A0A397JEG2_9GLOM|nr:hypothetical protein Glove_46g111 [Diversispora epigaea]